LAWRSEDLGEKHASLNFAILVEEELDFTIEERGTGSPQEPHRGRMVSAQRRALRG